MPGMDPVQHLNKEIILHRPDNLEHEPTDAAHEIVTVGLAFNLHGSLASSHIPHDGE